MTAPRTRLDDLTSSALDDLYDELDRLRSLVAHLTGHSPVPPVERWHLEARVDGRWSRILRDLTDRDSALAAYRRRRDRHPDIVFRLLHRVTTTTVDDPDDPRATAPADCRSHPQPGRVTASSCPWCAPQQETLLDGPPAHG